MERVVFFGTGAVAAQALELLTQHCSVEAVVTKPKPAHHRGDYPVLDMATKLNLPVKTVQNKAELSELMAAKPFTSSLGVLIDFGIIVSQDVIDYFPKGIVNSHFSLLPEWRGADPITFAILSGQKKTGVSLMLLVEKMDEGPLLGQAELDIAADETTASLTTKLIELSDGLLKTILPMWVKDEIEAGDQLKVSLLEDKTPTYSRKLTKADGKLDWNKPAIQLEREVRAFLDWPKSYTNLLGKDVIVTKAHVVPGDTKGSVGNVIASKETWLIMVQTSRGYLRIDSLKPVGKNDMTAKQFLAGYGTSL